MKRRIAYMIGEYPRATDTFIQREVESMRRLGVHVQTISVRKPAASENVGPEQHDERRRTYYLLPCSPLRLCWSHLNLLVSRPIRYSKALALSVAVRPPGIKAFLYQLFYFAEAGLVADFMKRQGLQHVHNHGEDSSCTVAMISSVLTGSTFSFAVHGPDTFFAPKRWCLDEKARRALFVTCISHFARSQMMIFSRPEDWKRLHIVHCGVDSARYRVVEHRGHGTRLLYVGRLSSVKGLPVLFRAFADFRSRLPGVTLDVVGDGPDRKLLESMVAELGIQDRVIFHGYFSRAQVGHQMEGSDVFVLTSFAEGVPVVLMEAMASGLPVVTSRVAGIAELVDDGVSGFLVHAGDHETFGARIADLVADAQLRGRFGAAGRAKVESEFNLFDESVRLCQIMESYFEGRPCCTRPAVQDHCGREA